MDFLHKNETPQVLQVHVSNQTDMQISKTAPLSGNDYITFTTASESNDDMTKDLSSRIGKAISEWTQKYHLEGIPTEIVLDQVLNIITAVRGTFQ